jgi:hypothetical protein
MNAIGTRLAAEQASLYAVPKVAQESAHEDVELRSIFRGMTEAQRRERLGQLDDPQHERMVLALLRSPDVLDPTVCKVAQSVWEKRVASLKPKEAAALTLARENHDWSMRFVRHIGQQIAESAWPTTDNRRFNFQPAYTALRGVKAVDMLGFGDHQKVRLEQAAAAADAARAAA